MKKIVSGLICICALTTACCTLSWGAREDKSPNLPDDYFSTMTVCTQLWGKLFVEWEKNGGGVKTSVLATRKQIAQDKNSKLATLIRKTWSLQKEPIRNVAFGSWPIDEKEQRRVLDHFNSATEGLVPGTCGYFDLVGSDLWYEAYHNKPDDVPSNLKWEPHEASLWLGYWLFARVE